jgi:hypothetical protein
MDLLNIHLLAQEFYALEAVSALLSVSQNNSFEPMRHSHSRWRRDFDDFRNEYNQKFASAIFDYTVSVVAAELRHCKNRASQYINDYYTTFHSRDAVYEECSVYRPYDILTAGFRMFDTSRTKWNDGFGGEKWKQIARAGLMRDKVIDCIFIDHCVDLSHNNSVYFDKGAGIFSLPGSSSYQNFLNLKFFCKPQALIDIKHGLRFNRLLQRVNTLNIIDVQAAGDLFAEQIYKDKAETLLLGYQPIKWGDKRVDCSESNITSKDGFVCNQRRESYHDDDCGREDVPYAA